MRPGISRKLQYLSSSAMVGGRRRTSKNGVIKTLRVCVEGYRVSYLESISAMVGGGRSVFRQCAFSLGA